MTGQTMSRRALPRTAACVGVGLLIATLAALPRPALAFARYRTDTAARCPFYWSKRSLSIVASPKGAIDLTVEETTNAIQQAVSAWTKRDAALSSCTDLDMTVKVQGVDEPPPLAKYDRTHVIIFLTTSWCVAKDDGTLDPDCKVPHDPSALAVTSVWSHKVYGEIMDADIEVNAKNFLWGDLVTTPDPSRQDLQNALTHEMGHFIGLDHTCYLPGVKTVPTDDTGAPVPDCDSASPEIMATTMFASARPGDVAKRTLEADDIAAVCAMYPAGAPDTEACLPPDEGGCAIAPPGEAAPRSPLTSPWAFGATGTALLGAVGWGLARRNQRRRR